jgi:hypothetical protein
MVKNETMKKHFAIGVSLVVLLASGCKDHEAEARKAKEKAEAMARAEAARKEMDALPKAFQTPDYFEKNKPEAKSAPAPVQPKPNS